MDGGKAFGFLLLLALAARFGTRIVGHLFNTKDDELLVISFLGAAVFVAGVSEWFGVADAIGAFMVGLMLGSTTSGERIRKLVHPLRDAFGAIFFFAFGLSIDPGDLPTVLWPVLAAVAVTLVMNVFAGLGAARVYGFGPGPAANISTTLLARGEFALILATMAAGAGLDERLSPFIAGYVLLLAVLGAAGGGPLGVARAASFQGGGGRGAPRVSGWAPGCDGCRATGASSRCRVRAYRSACAVRISRDAGSASRSPEATGTRERHASRQISSSARSSLTSLATASISCQAAPWNPLAT